jgi:hypothetical protein
MMEFNKDHYEVLKPIVFYWEALKRDGSLTSISPSELQKLSDVHFDLQGIRPGRCNDCVRNTLNFVFGQYEQFELKLKANENTNNTNGIQASRERRPRIQNKARS